MVIKGNHFCFWILLLLIAISSHGFSCLSTHYHKAQDAHKKGSYDEAIKFYSEALKEKDYSTETEIFTERGVAFLGNNQFKSAIRDFEQVFLLDSDKAQLNNNRGVSLYYQGKFEEALDAFNKSLQLSPIGYTNVLWSYLTSQKLNQPGVIILSNWSNQHNAEGHDFLPATLVSLNLNKISPTKLFSELEEKEIERNYRCISYFHIGQFYLLQKKNNLADFMFRRALDTGAVGVIEYAAAKLELERL